MSILIYFYKSLCNAFDGRLTHKATRVFNPPFCSQLIAVITVYFDDSYEALHFIGRTFIVFSFVAKCLFLNTLNTLVNVSFSSNPCCFLPLAPFFDSREPHRERMNV